MCGILLNTCSKQNLPGMMTILLKKILPLGRLLSTKGWTEIDSPEENGLSCRWVKHSLDFLKGSWDDWF